MLDVQGRGPGTFYASVDPATYAAISREASKLQIRKDDGQTVVFNVAGSPNALHKFDINGRGADSYLDKNAGSMPETIVWNLHDAETLGIRGSVTGVVLAPKATVSVEATSSGWLVAKNVNIGSGEWHNVNQQVRPVRPGMPDVPEQPGTPEQPEAPERPGMPEQPETPEQPGTPEQPETPEQPDMPESPEVPETPEDPERPGIPERPGDILYPEGDSSGSDESQPEPKVVLRARKVTANEEARPLEGSTYGLWRRGDDSEDTHVASDTSDSDGYLHFELPTTDRATYYLVEERAPFGYLLNPYPTDPLTFGVDEQGSFLVFAEGPDAEPVRPAWDESGEIATFDYLPTRNPVADEPVTLAVEKLDRDTLTEVTGAQLQLVDKESGEVVEEWVSGDEEHVLSGVLHTHPLATRSPTRWSWSCGPRTCEPWASWCLVRPQRTGRQTPILSPWPDAASRSCACTTRRFCRQRPSRRRRLTFRTRRPRRRQRQRRWSEGPRRWPRPPMRPLRWRRS